MTKRVMRVPTPSPLLDTPGGFALSDSEKSEALADSLEAYFQLVNDPSDSAVIEMVNEALQAYSFSCKRAQVNKPRGGAGCHQVTQGGQGSGRKRYSENGCESPSAASYIPSRHDIERGSSCAVLTSSMEVRPHYLHFETWEGPSATLVVSSHKSSGHHWQVL